MKVLVRVLHGFFGVGNMAAADREVGWRRVGEWALKVGWVVGI